MTADRWQWLRKWSWEDVTNVQEAPIAAGWVRNLLAENVQLREALANAVAMMRDEAGTLQFRAQQSEYALQNAPLGLHDMTRSQRA